MEIYQVKVLNPNIDDMPVLHFKEKRTAEMIVNGFNAITKPGKTIEWECSIINVMSHEEALEQILNIEFENNGET